MLERDIVAVSAEPGESVIESRCEDPRADSVGEAGRPGEAGMAEGGGGDEPSSLDVLLGDVARIVEVTGPLALRLLTDEVVV